jgi:hypothetical protein
VLTPEELYALWAPDDSVWSPWVLPVPFAQLICPEVSPSAVLPEFNLDWLQESGTTDSAIVADLPGGDAIYYGLNLLVRGYRPVPVIDGSPGPELSFLFPTGPSSPTGELRKSASFVDMRGLLMALCQGAGRLREAKLAPDAPPSFLLDSKRMTRAAYVAEGAFDNRWMVFPQDFPSGRFLRDRGIRRVIYVHDTFLTQPPDDLAHVLLRWQEDGIAMESKSARFGDAPVPIQVNKPSRFRAAWYRALAALGLRRNDAGGFGAYPPSPAGAG